MLSHVSMAIVNMEEPILNFRTSPNFLPSISSTILFLHLQHLLLVSFCIPKGEAVLANLSIVLHLFLSLKPDFSYSRIPVHLHRVLSSLTEFSHSRHSFHPLLSLSRQRAVLVSSCLDFHGHSRHPYHNGFRNPYYHFHRPAGKFRVMESGTTG